MITVKVIHCYSSLRRMFFFLFSVFFSSFAWMSFLFYYRYLVSFYFCFRVWSNELFACLWRLNRRIFSTKCYVRTWKRLMNILTNFKLIRIVLPTAIWESVNCNRLKSARNKWKRSVVSVDKMCHFHFQKSLQTSLHWPFTRIYKRVN